MQKEYEMNEELLSVINSIKTAIIQISKLLNNPDTSYASTKNQSGDAQLELDLQSDKLIEIELSKNPNIAALISEEKEDILSLDKNQSLIVAYDPLDGSSLLDVNFSIGSIFGIYEDKLEYANLKAAIYAIYGPRLELVICTDEALLYRYYSGEFAFIKKLFLKEKGKINASGGSQKNWPKNHRALIRSLFDEGYRLRYSGAMVSDLHLILLKQGGLFSYPATTDAPQGKLRALFEVFPFTYIFKKSNGYAIDGKNSLCDFHPKKLHSTTACYFGSKYEIELALKANKE